MENEIDLIRTTKQKLERLEQILIEKKAPIIQHFNPGLSKEEILIFLKSNHIKPIPSLVALYEWHNGMKTVYGYYGPEIQLLPFGSFLNLNEMVQLRKIFYEWAEEDFKDLDNYIPFLGTGESDMFLLNLTTGEVLNYQPMIQIDGDLAFDSIDTMLDCIVECFAKEAFSIDQKEGLIIDFDKYSKIQENFLQSKEN